MTTTPSEHPVVGLSTLQFHVGGFPELPVRGLGSEAHPAATRAVASHAEER